MSAHVTVRHNFESGHRLPILQGKCQNLHGHSWWAEVTVTAPGTPLTVVEFGAYKARLRAWIDEQLDHGLMLGHEDPLAKVLAEFGKVYVFGPDDNHWPTVENVAAMLARVATQQLFDVVRAPGAYVSAVKVSETHVNAASWTPGDRERE